MRSPLILTVLPACACAAPPDGSAPWQAAFWTAALLAVGVVLAAAALLRAAAARHAGESAGHQRRVVRLTSFYAALTQTNQLIVREPDEATLLGEICRICVETGHAHMSCVHLLDGDTVTRVATAGRSLAFYESLPTTWSIQSEDTKDTLASRVMRGGERLVHQDYQAEQLTNRWRELTRKHDILAVATFPLRRGGRLAGALSLYANERHFFDDALVQLADEIARDLSYALDNLDRRAHALAAAQARAGQAAAEAANEAKTAFLSKMSHELRTPLNAMLGFTQLIQRDARERLAPADMAQLDQIREAGWHLLSLVNDVLDVSRIESGQLDVQVRAIALAPLLEESLRISEPLAAQSGIALHAGTGGMEPVHVSADPVRLRQVLINLLSNATKYNRPGGSVRLDVRATPDRVVLTVTDTGLGMTAQQLEHLYEPFNRLGREAGGIEGTGLGLAVTRQLIRLMGGELDFQSQVGTGTQARVTLQRADASAVAEPADGGDLFDAIDRTLTGQVLYVEDNEINVLVVEQMLAEWPRVQFIHAPDGLTGIDLARRLQPDLMLLDMNMPDMGGLEVLARLQADPATRPVRVVVLSASAMAKDIAAAMAAGAIAYWTKPLDFRQFLQDVGRLLARAPADAIGIPASPAEG